MVTKLDRLVLATQNKGKFVEIQRLLYGTDVDLLSLADFTNVPDIVEDAISGLVVTPGDSRELAQAIERLLSQRELRVTFGLAARKRAEEIFTLEKSVHEYEVMYREVVKKT